MTDKKATFEHKTKINDHVTVEGLGFESVGTELFKPLQPGYLPRSPNATEPCRMASMDTRSLVRDGRRKMSRARFQGFASELRIHKNRTGRYQPTPHANQDDEAWRNVHVHMTARTWSFLKTCGCKVPLINLGGLIISPFRHMRARFNVKLSVRKPHISTRGCS
jgi:hypothetical protein